LDAAFIRLRVLEARRLEPRLRLDLFLPDDFFLVAIFISSLE
jgi:hypothetical protein